MLSISYKIRTFLSSFITKWRVINTEGVLKINIHYFKIASRPLPHWFLMNGIVLYKIVRLHSIFIYLFPFWCSKISLPNSALLYYIFQVIKLFQFKQKRKILHRGVGKAQRVIYRETHRITANYTLTRT